MEEAFSRGAEVLRMLLRDHLKGVDPEIRDVILAIAEGAKKVRRGFLKAGTSAGTVNASGEAQLEMDKWADAVFFEELKRTGIVFAAASEERDEVEMLSGSGKFSVTLDPLDGSSLMGVDLTVGTIVGIFRSNTPMKPGKDMAGAAYVLYGPLTVLVYTVGAGVHEFALTDDGEFVLQQENLVIGQERIYSPGALRKEYLPYHLRFIERLESEGYKLRFCGSFVADVHQILHKGGVFTYPAFKGKDQGKLRLLFEANPMGFIVRAAGGRISDGRRDILELVPEKLHQRVPIYVGGTKEISMIEEELRKEA
jgi:fructose-1,6-bisphosphatase I